MLIAVAVGSPGLPAEHVARAFLELSAGEPDRATADIVLRP